ncbi:MAG: hypothetical protein JNM83_16690 [Myxococcales bacterium]|nr:hypothetical protein [Myxococcales bacterium]
MAALPQSPWFSVVGGPPPAEEVLRAVMLSLVLPLGGLCVGLFLPESWRLPFAVLSAAAMIPLFLLLRLRWRTRQQVRVFGNVVEHRDGGQVTRVALTRAVVSAAAAPPGMLVMVLDDGRQQVTVARRADLQELSGLPPCLGPYLELDPEDFEIIRLAANRPYAQA